LVIFIEEAVMKRTVVPTFPGAICMTTFETDRDLIAGLSDKHAFSILGLLDGGLPHDEAPPEFRAALAAVQRSPDVSRYILVNKTQKYVADQCQRGRGIE
jgi:hypothetical protein